MIEKEIQGGGNLTCDFFPFMRTVSDLRMVVPSWAREGGKRKILENINNPAERKNLITGLKDLTLHYERITVASTLFDSGSVGKTIFELSEIAGTSPEEVILNLLEANDLEVAIFNEVISEDNLMELGQKDYALLASDGVGYNIDTRVKNNLPHPRSFTSFPRFLELFVKEKQLISWEKAINKMTARPAEILGLKDRGAIKEKFFADLVVLNPKTIEGKADYQNPYLLSKGIDHVIINGEVALKDGQLTSILPGRILKKA
jgi:N-acyl-D-amino-acid deacylase